MCESDVVIPEMNTLLQVARPVTFEDVTVNAVPTRYQSELLVILYGPAIVDTPDTKACVSTIKLPVIRVSS